MNISDEMLHPLKWDEEFSAWQMNDPFDYTPHSSVVAASQEVVASLKAIAAQDQPLSEELQRGKMLGVLVVVTPSSEVGYLTAFSGAIAGRSSIDGFVPPIYDLDCEDGYFRVGEREISALNSSISELERAEEYSSLLRDYDACKEQMIRRLAEARAQYSAAKRVRDERRRQEVDMGSDTISALQRESQYQRGELRRLEQQLKGELVSVQCRLDSYRAQIERLRSQRSKLSNDLQSRLFSSYCVINGYGESRSLLSIFKERYDRLPPAGAGECAAPKLLNYALKRGYRPLAIGEFWVGESPRSEVRRDGHFYGACHGKCLPILNYMLQGVDVAVVSDELARDREVAEPLEVVFEDDYLIAFNKPSGMLSVRGRINAPSVESVVRERYHSAMMLHRLDQDTSGVLLVAKSADVHRNLQRQFTSRSVEKRYLALLESPLEVGTRGEISLPLRPNPMDRPRQEVDYRDGKEATTSYEVLDVLTREGEPTSSLIALYPHTGRTHQLRLHCAHKDGLSIPILGDRLYGGGVKSYPRLALHAESITFNHPATGERMTLRVSAPNLILE